MNIQEAIDFVTTRVNRDNPKWKKNLLSLTVNYINFVSVIALIPLLLFPHTHATIICYYVFFASYLIEILTDKKWENFRFDKIKLYYLVMAMFFLLAIIYLPFEKTNTYTSIILERRLALIGFAVVGFFGVNALYKLNYFLYAFILTSVTAILYLLFYRIGIYELITNPEPFKLFAEKRILYVGSHMKVNLYLIISIIGIWHILRNNWKNRSRWIRISLITALAIILTTLLISEGRAGFIIGVLFSLIFILIETYTRWKKAGIAYAILLPILFAGIISQQQRLAEDLVSNDPRTFLWKSAWEVIKERPLLGHGVCDAQVTFDEKKYLYQTNEFQEYSVLMEQSRNEKYQDSHNQYLQVMMEFGIFGLIFLLFLFIYPIFAVGKNKRLFNIFIVSLCMFLSVFDMYITRLYTPLFGILTLMMLVAKSDEKTKDEKSLLCHEKNMCHNNGKK